MKRFNSPLLLYRRVFMWIVLTLFAICSPTFIFCQEQSEDLLTIYPATSTEKPDILSPLQLTTGEEFLLIKTYDLQFSTIPVTIEAGEPRNYPHGQWGKGDQLTSNSVDFPALSRTGLHEEADIKRLKTITGKPIDRITIEARPEGSSSEGFIAADETIQSVLLGDNQLVKELGLRHPELARPLFHIYNMILHHRIVYLTKERPFKDIQSISYNSRDVEVSWGGAKGFQNSIFNDTIMGYYFIDIKRSLDDSEMDYIQKKYGHLDEDQMESLINKLTTLRIGEMVVFYIQRYGFYEGHTSWRADPIAISFIFGLLPLEEIDQRLTQDLYTALFQHHIPQK